MPNASPPRRSVFKGKLCWQLVQVPVSVYLSEEEFSIKGSLFHENCDGKIKSPPKCEKHPEEEFPATYSAVEFEDGFVRIDSDTRNFLLKRDSDEIHILSAHSLSELPKLMLDSTFVFRRFYELAPQRLKQQPKAHSDFLMSMLHRMQQKRKFLLISCPFDGMQRFAILLPNGQIITLAYEEEIREQFGFTGNIDKSFSPHFDKMFAELEGEIPQLSCQDIIDGYEQWLEAAKGGKVIMAKPGPITAAHIDIMEALERSINA